MNALHLAYPVSDPSQPGEIRRAAVALATQLGFAAADVGRVGLAATEASTNIVKHAGKGTILLRAAPELADRPGIELLALDQGPGMVDVARCMQDGYSTAGSPGTGLGALSRLAAQMEIFATPGKGTALLVRVLPQGAVLSPQRAAIGAIRVPKTGESECGDDWALAYTHEGRRFLLADGLGHGPVAAKAGEEAVRAFLLSAEQPLPEAFSAVHLALRPTRGAAVSMADVTQAEVRFGGIGNVVGFLSWPRQDRRMVTQNGTLGLQFSQVRITTYPFTSPALLVLHSDGLNTHASLDGYAGLHGYDPSLIAGVLFRDFSRGTDDATVVVARLGRNA
jgi:anti-sigma regulatory factor (Ser/Thr protein kinase)